MRLENGFRTKYVRPRILWLCVGLGLIWDGVAISDTPEGIPFAELQEQVQTLQGQLEMVERGPDGACYDNSNRYVDCGNGTVTDTVTGLVWLKDANCFGLQDYATANSLAASLEHDACGLTDNSRPGDWRLPTAEEWSATLFTARELDCDPPALTDTVGTGCFSVGPSPFVNVFAPVTPMSGGYWSANTVDQPFGTQPASAHIGFIGIIPFDLPANAFVGQAPKSNTNPVWPVRGVSQRCTKRVGAGDPSDCF